MLANKVLQDVLSTAGIPAGADQVQWTGSSLQLPSTYHVGALASGTVAAQAVAAAQIWRQRGGEAQQVSVDQRHAQVLFRSERYLQVNGQPPADLWSPLAGYYQAGDGRWIQLHTNFEHHRDGVLRVLGCANDKAAVAAAIAQWRAEALEEQLAQAGMCASMIRSPAEWQQHPQSAALAGLPLFEIERIGDAAPRALPASPARPLSGVRMLDLSRVIAAPVAAKMFAQHGADVLAVSAAHLPNILPLVMDTGRAKRSACLDLRTAEANATLHQLIGGSDIFLQAYRPGALAGLGFSAEELCRRHPGLICVSLSAYSHRGPWATRRGFDSLTQSATGIAYEEGVAAGLSGPGKLPCQALDHATGMLAALGAMAALQRRATEGGSWHVRVSLAQTGHYLQQLGRCGLHENSAELSADEIAACLQEQQGPFGLMSAVAPADTLSVTPPFFASPSVPPGTHPASWW